MKAPVLSAQLVWCYTIGGSFFFHHFFHLCFGFNLGLQYLKKFQFFMWNIRKQDVQSYFGSHKECVVQVGSIQTVDVAMLVLTTDEASSDLNWWCRLAGQGTRTRFSKPAKHVFLQLHYRHKLIKTHKSCISSAQLKGPHASLSAHALQIAVQKCPHTTALVLCFIVF